VLPYRSSLALKHALELVAGEPPRAREQGIDEPVVDALDPRVGCQLFGLALRGLKVDMAAVSDLKTVIFEGSILPGSGECFRAGGDDRVLQVSVALIPVLPARASHQTTDQPSE